jgi:hypothetical protein
MKMIRWAIATIPVQDHVREDNENLLSYLELGWEPYAVTRNTPTHYYHLRLAVKDD